MKGSKSVKFEDNKTVVANLAIPIPNGILSNSAKAISNNTNNTKSEIINKRINIKQTQLNKDSKSSNKDNLVTVTEGTVSDIMKTQPDTRLNTESNVTDYESVKKNIDLITKSVTSKKNTANQNSLTSFEIKNLFSYQNPITPYRINSSPNNISKPQFSDKVLNKYKSTKPEKIITSTSSLVNIPNYQKSIKSIDKSSKNSKQSKNNVLGSERDDFPIPAKINYRTNSEYKEIEILKKQIKILSIGNNQ